MEHTPKVVGQKQVNNEQVAYRIVCCDETCSRQTCVPTSHNCEDTWHTIAINLDNHDELLQEQLTIVAARHAKMHDWRSKQKN